MRSHFGIIPHLRTQLGMEEKEENILSWSALEHLSAMQQATSSRKDLDSQMHLKSMPQLWGIEPVAQVFYAMASLAGGTFGIVVCLTVNTYRAVGQIAQALSSGSAQ